MVSLARNSRGGGIFFGDTSVSSEYSDLQQIHPTVEKSFHPLHTVFVVIFQLLAVVGIIICGIIMATVWPKDKAKCEPYFILIYIHSVFWCISFIVHHHLQLEHHTLRLNGYLDFHKETQNHLSIPFHIVSLCNTVILVIGTIFHQLYEHFEEQCKATGFLTPVYYLIAIVTVEAVVLFPFVGSYIAKVVKFNKSKPAPDVLRDDWIASINDDALDGESNVRDSYPDVEELVEKQADLIRYLKYHNERLSRKILSLNAQIRQERT